MRKVKFILALAMILCLVSAVGAHLLQTDYGKVEVTEVKLPGSDGAFISGLLYRPVEATADNPLPLIITAHGSFNNKQMQDQNLIELSRRGFIVFAPDSYRHGKSSIHNENMGEFASLVDSVEALYNLNYVDKSKIAVTGHSMGADQSNNTVRYYIEQAATGNGINKISAILSIGCDPPYSSYDVEGLAEAVPITINYGVVEAKYDEWFFKQEDTNMNPALYLESKNAKAFIEQVGVSLEGPVENGKIYSGQIGDKSYVRVIYQNNEIHPLNTFSHATAASTINYFYTVFGTPSGCLVIEPNNQVWFIKELFNLIGLIGIFLFLYPLSRLLMETNYFKETVSNQVVVTQPKLSGVGQKVGFGIVTIIVAVIPALLLMPIGFKLIGQESFVPWVYSNFFGEANTNELAGWSIVVALVTLVVELVYYLVINKKGVKVSGWGSHTTLRQVLKSLLLALITVATAFALVFLLSFLFGTDFRFWVIAVQTFDASKLVYALIYFPAFAIFYLVNSILVNGCNNISGWKEWQKVLLSCICNVLGLAILVFIQYSALMRDGTITFNAMRIVNLFPLLVLIPVATIISRQYFKATNNIYTGSFVMAMFYSMIIVSNTMFMASLV